MISYIQRMHISSDGFVEAHPGPLGGTVLEGDPELRIRIDFNTPQLTGGLFRQTSGKVRIVWPATEHSLVLEGEVNIVDDQGRSVTFKPGDGFIIRKGDVVTWTVSTETFCKSFLFLNADQE